MKFVQRQQKVKETYLKCSKARNEYLLNLGASNATMKNFYIQDVSTLIDASRIFRFFCVFPLVLKLKSTKVPFRHVLYCKVWFLCTTLHWVDQHYKHAVILVLKQLKWA